MKSKTIENLGELSTSAKFVPLSFSPQKDLGFYQPLSNERRSMQRNLKTLEIP